MDEENGPQKGAEVKEAEIISNKNHEEEHSEKRHGSTNLIKLLRQDYLRNYRRNFYITIIFAVLLLVGTAGIYFVRGELFRKDISLKGGVAITLTRSDLGRDEILNLLLKQYPNSDVNVRELQSAGITTGLVIESSELSAEQIIDVLNQNLSGLKNSDYTVQIVSPALGASVFRQIIISIMVAFALMALTVFLY